MKAQQNYQDCHALFLSQLDELGLSGWHDDLHQGLSADYNNPHGDMPKWQSAVNGLPALDGQIDLLNAVKITGESDLTALQPALKKLMPWRKGPFHLQGLHLDTEWRSDWKWQRLAPHISDLTGRLVLDVGCGNGYYGWRMLGAGARYVVGIDPMRLFMMQFRAVRQLLGMPSAAIDVLPLRMENVTPNLQAFDTVFSMGVLYHRKSPHEHLEHLRSVLKQGGELVLETLVLPAGHNEVLVPEKRYAQMNNVWAVPPVFTLESWLQESGFKNIRTVDVSKTTLDEQRATDWMQFQSLDSFLDANNRGLTIEGYPAPVRAIVIAES